MSIVKEGDKLFHVYELEFEQRVIKGKPTLEDDGLDGRIYVNLVHNPPKVFKYDVTDLPDVHCVRNTLVFFVYKNALFKIKKGKEKIMRVDPLLEGVVKIEPESEYSRTVLVTKPNGDILKVSDLSFRPIVKIN